MLTSRRGRRAGGFLIAVICSVGTAVGVVAPPVSAVGTSGGIPMLWGDEIGLEHAIPPLTDVTSAAMGHDGGLALNADGTVLPWGEQGPPEGYPDISPAVPMPDGLDDVVAVATGTDDDYLALQSDGTLVAWGANNYGQDIVPAGLGHVISMAEGYDYTLAVTSDGTVTGWGRNTAGADPPPGLSGVVALSAWREDSLALTSNGTVVAWGANDSGQANVPAGLGDVTAISAGQGFNLALRADGTVAAWGADDSGQTDVPAGLTGVTAIAAGWGFALALKSDGTVVAWGKEIGQYPMTPPAGLDHVTAIAANYDAVAIVNGATAPLTGVSCGFLPCPMSGDYDPSSSGLSLEAQPLAGSPIDRIVYTTDGSDPVTSPTAHILSGGIAWVDGSPPILKYFAVDQAGNVEPVRTFVLNPNATGPMTGIACDGAACLSPWYPSSVDIQLVATDTGGPGIAATRYTTDGMDPTSSPTAQTYTGPFTVTSTSTVRYYSVDTAGNAEPAQSQFVGIDGVAPTTTISCNGAVCAAGWYTTSVAVGLSATDSGGSGVAVTRYTTDGTDPRSSSTAKMYSGPFTLTSKRTVRYYSTDAVGNVEQGQSQVVQIDRSAPTTVISCNGLACGGVFGALVTVTLPATDTGGSGLARTTYTTDGSDPRASATAQTYAGPFTVSRSTTVTAVSTDVAGNVEPPKSATIQIGTGTGSGPTTLTPTDDSYTAKGNANATHGGDGSLNVNSGTSERRAYLKFAVSAIPAGTTNLTATLKLYSQSAASSAVTFTVSQVATNWTEGTLTWNNQPAIGATVTSKPGLTDGAYNSLDVSNLITGNGTFALVITDNNTTQRYFSSKEASAGQRPQLVLSWTVPSS